MYQFPNHTPRFLNLREIRFCSNAIYSALHRISGAFLMACLFVYLLLATQLIFTDLSLASLQSSTLMKWVNTLFWISLYFHWLSGIKHMLGETLLKPEHYAFINGTKAKQILFHSWWLGSIVIIWNFLI